MNEESNTEPVHRQHDRRRQNHRLWRPNNGARNSGRAGRNRFGPTGSRVNDQEQPSQIDFSASNNPQLSVNSGANQNLHTKENLDLPAPSSSNSIPPGEILQNTNPIQGSSQIGSQKIRARNYNSGRGGRQRREDILLSKENDQQQQQLHETSTAPPRPQSVRGNRPGQSQRRPRGRSSGFRYLNDQTNLASKRELEEQSYEVGNTDYKLTAQNTESANIQSKIAEDQLRTNNFECMICCDTIHRSNSIWSCTNCYNIFHLKCAIEWCNKSIKSRDEAIANAQYPSLGGPSSQQTANMSVLEVRRRQGNYPDYQGERVNSVEWPCPTCREVRYSKPNKYVCFCGKVTRPEVNRHLTPHSCGQLCGKKRTDFDCPHTCNSICHPGRCTSCTLTSRRPCYCGKLISEIKCSLGTSCCGQVCGKSLSCGRHTCSKVCHAESCGSCQEVLTIKCHCGEQEKQLKCAEIVNRGKNATINNFSCDKICAKKLDCNQHYCELKCHPTPNCPSCKLLSQNIKTCPCGSTLIKKSLLLERKSCTDSVPTCENKCNRALVCGPEKNRHKCQKKCHTGPCPPCKLKSTIYCDCKLSTKTVECSLMYEKVACEDRVYFEQIDYSFSCETRCNKLKNCGRHRCYNKCCKFLKAPDIATHKCDQICNRKLPCGEHNCQETCHAGQCGDCTNIGWEELTCHCGASVLYPPIPCGARPPTCHRPCRRPHLCGHPVKHECHDETERCAPCTVFVKKSCFCSSESKDSVYCYLTGYSCGRTCKKQLACKQHNCKRVCHDNECETSTERGVILCTQPCPVKRYSCKHPCNLSCHSTHPCPTSECKKTLELTCNCGNKVERIECYKVMRDVDNRNKVAMLSTNRSNQDTIIIDLSKKTTPKSALEDESFLKKLDCDETCSILKRNKALAEALDIVQPDLKPASIFGEDPLRLLKEATAQDYKFVATTFNSLVKFIKSAKESEKRFIFMQFPPMEKLRREVVHELAHHFNCTSESQGDELQRHVVVRAYKNKSSVPDFTIEQLLPVFD